MQKRDMWMCIRRILAIVLIGFILFSWRSAYAWRCSMNAAESELIVIYDNHTLKKELTSAWGFSCLINHPRYHILFDTGGDSSILLKNMNRMDIDPRIVDSIVLSHIHGDHVGGLSGLLQYHHDVTVYLPKSFPRSFKEGVILTGARVKEVKEPVMIHSGVYTTGELGVGIKEQSLVLKTREGLCIVTGCAHPGIIEIVKQARRLFRDKVHLLIGGFHLMGGSSKEIKGIIKNLEELEVEMVAPCHCSGDTARKFFGQHFKESYIECGAGLALEIPDLKE